MLFLKRASDQIDVRQLQDRGTRRGRVDQRCIAEFLCDYNRDRPGEYGVYAADDAVGFVGMTTASTPKGERRRQALVEAAATLLVEGGFDAVKHRAVAERAGLPLASTTYYFDSLDELIAAAVEHHSRGELVRGRALLSALPVGPPAEQPAIDSVIDLVLDQLLGPPTDKRDAELVLLRYERLVATFRRPYLRPLVRTRSIDLRRLLHEVFTRSGIPVDDAASSSSSHS